jgi:hypothetical protein
LGCGVGFRAASSLASAARRGSRRGAWKLVVFDGAPDWRCFRRGNLKYLYWFAGRGKIQIAGDAMADAI